MLTMDHLGSCFGQRVLSYRNTHFFNMVGSLFVQIGVNDYQ